MILRPYQARAVDAARAAWADGARRVCLVMPTGAGKTITAAAIVGADALWLVHRRELAHQAPGRAVTIQQLVASGDRPEADVIVADEAHHLAPGAEQWHAVAAHYPRILGLTATPQRGDGSALGDLFDRLVVGATYSELLTGGHIVEARVYRPPEPVDGLARDPADAWRTLAGDRQGFAYFSRVELAERFAAAMGPTCATITGTTPDDVRGETLARFRRGELRCLSNVAVLTEGIDVPEASVCLIARGCDHASTYLQMVGRVLRPAPGKDHAVVIDLPGASHTHGLPTEDREYSLSGRAIKSKLEPLRVCAACGLTQVAGPDHCTGCGTVWPLSPARPPRIWDLPLEEARAVAATADERAALAAREALSRHTERQRTEKYRALQQLGRERGYKPGWAKYQYRMRYGRWPRC
jgi:superfamily II DNA or RNA helicase